MLIIAVHWSDASFTVGLNNFIESKSGKIISLLASKIKAPIFLPSPMFWLPFGCSCSSTFPHTHVPDLEDSLSLWQYLQVLERI